VCDNVKLGLENQNPKISCFFFFVFFFLNFKPKFDKFCLYKIKILHSNSPSRKRLVIVVGHHIDSMRQSEDLIQDLSKGSRLQLVQYHQVLNSFEFLTCQLQINQIGRKC